MSGLVDKGNAVDIVYLDFSKAFDTVSYKSLLNKQLTKELDAQTVRKLSQSLVPEGADPWNKSSCRSVTSSTPGDTNWDQSHLTSSLMIWLMVQSTLSASLQTTQN